MSAVGARRSRAISHILCAGFIGLALASGPARGAPPAGGVVPANLGAVTTGGEANRKPGGIKILFLGDSLTEGYGIAKDKAYPALVVERLNDYFVQRRMAKRVEGLYAGISGSTSASAVSRLRWFLKARPKILFLALGANDGLRGVPAAELEKNLDATIALAKENGMSVILAGMKLPPNYGKKNAADFEAVYARLAKKHSLTLVPFLLEAVGGEKELNLEDGVHPNEKGHRKVAETVFPYLEKALL